MLRSLLEMECGLAVRRRFNAFDDK